MFKIYCCVISILFLGVCFPGYNAEASDAIRYISNRVKIIRPEKFAKTSEIETKNSVTPDLQKAETDTQVVSGEATQPGEGMSDEVSEAEIREEVASLIGKQERFYSRKGRIDPFEPFLRKPEPEVTSDETDRLARRIPRTPLEKIDLSQLTLTAVLRTPTKTKALVQEASGKGYVISEGTFVGNKGGQVSKILKDRVLVEEKFLDVFGKISVRERELKLQQ